MSSLIGILTEEHRRMAKILSLLDLEMDRFKEGMGLDYMLIRSILDYMSRVSQLTHHKIEDAIYTRVIKYKPDADIEDIRIEHDKLEFLCHTLSEAVDNVERDSQIPRMWLVSVAKEYQTAMRAHLREEESRLFPIARELLTEADWESIEDEVDRKIDPDFDRIERTDLRELRQDIVNWH